MTSNNTDSWRLFSTFGDTKVYCEKNEVFCQTGDQRPVKLTPPEISLPLNDDEKLKMDKDVVREGNHAWTRRPVLAFFNSDGSQLTVNWEVCAHEMRYGWEYSHGIAQRKIWKKVIADGVVTWEQTETSERTELHWAYSEDEWT